jgi:hypothetical protein
MARGDPAMKLENLVPYFRGGRFAVLAMRHRHRRHDADLETDADRYVRMVDHYAEAAVATFRLHREREKGGAGSG